MEGISDGMVNFKPSYGMVNFKPSFAAVVVIAIYILMCTNKCVKYLLGSKNVYI